LRSASRQGHAKGLLFLCSAGLTLARGLPQDCERRGGFCSHGSCPPGIGRIGICSKQVFCCR
ncbi:GLL5 protein, partial [Mesembrinibis cayennensis]|nr:GLL5 protein [Mesembrinibis cayennensis]